MATHCETCGSPLSNSKNRYCHHCGKAVHRRMVASGYLQNTYVPPYFSDERGRTGMRDPRVLTGAPY